MYKVHDVLLVTTLRTDDITVENPDRFKKFAYLWEGACMNNENKRKVRKKDEGKANKNKRQPYRLRLPGFITEEDVGLGDVIKRATSSVGIKPCGGCERRAAALNRWVVFSARRTR